MLRLTVAAIESLPGTPAVVGGRTELILCARLALEQFGSGTPNSPRKNNSSVTNLAIDVM